jgi:hypothetical protein
MKWNEYTNTMDVWNKKPFTPEEKRLDVSNMFLEEVSLLDKDGKVIWTTRDITKVY